MIQIMTRVSLIYHLSYLVFCSSLSREGMLRSVSQFLTFDKYLELKCSGCVVLAITVNKQDVIKN